MATKSVSVMRPIGDHIIVRPDESKSVTDGGIHLPENAQDKSTRGRVVAVGSGQLLRDGTRAKLEVSEGDAVIYGKFGGTEVEVDGERLVVLRECDVLLVL